MECKQNFRGLVVQKIQNGPIFKKINLLMARFMQFSLLIILYDVDLGSSWIPWDNVAYVFFLW